jgi:bifunctional non-homologous end joining protein LigD
MNAEVRAGRRTVSVSSPDRVVFPRAGLTKLDLASYYAEVADVMVPHVRGRPLALQSYPDGVLGESYFVKNVPAHYPSWIATAQVPRRGGGSIRQALANDGATLVYLAGQNVVTPHVWTSRADRLEQPDRIIFDLDPSTKHFDEVRAAARELGSLLRDLGFTPFAMTTGSRGLHVVVPLRRTAPYDEVHAFSHDVATLFAASNPAKLTTEFHVKDRGERLFLDVGRNAYGQHAVAPYAVRGLPDAPVATPLRWEELEDPQLRSQRWSIRTLRARLDTAGDPWREIARHARALGPAQRELRRLGGPAALASRA